jgi:S-adenosylmethionine synthetase
MNAVIVGKVTSEVGNVPIPIDDIAQQAARDALIGPLPLLDPSRELTVTTFTNSAVGAGRPSSWYRPTSAVDAPADGTQPGNDTAVCTAYAPLSPLEALVLHLDEALRSPSTRAAFPGLGTDVKIMASRVERDVNLTVCIPLVARLTDSRAHYDRQLRELVDLLESWSREYFAEYNYAVQANTRDDANNVYMTHLGSAADTGDVGVVGRGNRLNGLISPFRMMSTEAPCGKNPRYHVGKVYSVLAQEIANDVMTQCGKENYVTLVGQNGAPLSHPLVTSVGIVGHDPAEDDQVEAIVSKRLASVGDLCHRLATTPLIASLMRLG